MLLACPFEVLPDYDLEAKPDPRKMPGMVKALDMMGYDAGALTLDEAGFLKKSGAPLPAAFTVLATEPQTKLVTLGGDTIGIVFFPPSPDPKKPAPAALGDAVAQAAKALRDKARLVIGLSGLGMGDEKAFLETHPGTLDILLGSGPNAGNAGQPSADGKTLWARTYIKGKTINRLDLFALPGGPDFAWKPGQTYKTSVISLDERYPADPAVEKLFQ